MNELIKSAILVIFLLSLIAVFQQVCLYHIFKSRLWKHLFEKKKNHWWDLKPWISMAIGITWVVEFNIDFANYIFGGGSFWLTKIMSGMFIAGGSTGAIKFFKSFAKVFSEFKEFKKELALSQNKK